MSDLVPVRGSRALTRPDQAISPREIAYVISRRRWLILGIALPILIVAATGLLKRTGGVVASSKVLLEMRTPVLPQWNTATASVDEDRLLSTYQHLAMSVPVAQRAADALIDSLPNLRSFDPDLAHLTSRAALVEFLMNGLNVTLVGESSILDLRFSAVDARAAIMADRACRDAFLDYSANALVNSEAISYYQDQIASIGAEIDSLLKQRAEILRDTGYTSFQDDLRFNAGQVATLQDKVFEAEANLRFIESKVAYFRKAWAENPDFMPFGEQTMENAPLIDAKLRVDKYRDILSQLLTKFTPTSPEVVKQQELLESSQRLFAQTKEDFLQGYEAEAAAARAKEQALRQQRDQLLGSLSAAPEIYRQVSMIDADIDARRTVLKELQSKLGEVRISQMADSRVNRLIKLTEPEIDLVISGSRQFVYFFMVSFFGLALSLLVAFIVDQQDHRIYTRRQLEQALNVPVISTITDAETRVARR